MKNPFFASRPGSVVSADTKNLEEVLVETGLNSGNLLFFSAARKVISHTTPSSGMSFDAAMVRERHDGIVIPAANWLTARRDFGNMARLIEEADLPTVILGLGAQAFENKVPELLPGTKRFLKALSDRCHSISVRGDFTAEVVTSAGIKNVVVTGCPSLLWRVTAPASVRKGYGSLTKVSVNGTRYDEPGMLDKEGKSYIGLLMMRYAKTMGFDYVAQTEKDDIVASRPDGDAALPLSTLRFLARVYGAGSVADVRSYLAEHLRFFHDPALWIDYMAGRQLSFGTRLHGVIAALLAGTPGILVTHDTRTEEMAERAGIPNVSARSVVKDGINLDALYAAADFEIFNRKQQIYYADFLDFFAKNDVENNLVQNTASIALDIA